MKEISATDFARKLSQILDEVTFREKEFLITRNKQPVARLLPGPEISEMTALEAMADLYRTLPEDAGHSWVTDSRMGEKLDVKTNRWDS
jgi:prevent-host-death family protein